VVGLEEGLLDAPVLVLLDVAQRLQVAHGDEDVLAHLHLDRIPVLVGVGVVERVHAVAPAVDDHGAEQGPERILALDGFEIEIAADPFGDAVDHGTELGGNLVIDLQLQEAAEHGLEDPVGVGGGHLVAPGAGLAA
jgi:hypothetical protein